MQHNVIHDQPNQPLANYLRAHRVKAGFTQEDVAAILDYVKRDAIARHERLDSMPSLLVALSYEVLYRIPVSEIFAGITETVEFKIEAQLAALEDFLGRQSAHGPRAAAIAHKLDWLSERRSSG